MWITCNHPTREEKQECTGRKRKDIKIRVRWLKSMKRRLTREVYSTKSAHPVLVCVSVWAVQILFHWYCTLQFSIIFRCFWSFLSLVFSGISMAFSRMSPGFPGISLGFLWSSLVFCPNADRSAVSPVKSRQALNGGFFWVSLGVLTDQQFRDGQPSVAHLRDHLLWELFARGSVPAFSHPTLVEGAPRTRTVLRFFHGR